MDNLREELNKAIDVFGLDYEKLIDLDTELHKKIIEKQKGMIRGKDNV